LVPNINERTQAGCIGEEGAEGDTGANSAEQIGEWRKLHEDKVKKNGKPQRVLVGKLKE